jgi:hypothetical protein
VLADSGGLDGSWAFGVDVLNALEAREQKK